MNVTIVNGSFETRERSLAVRCNGKMRISEGEWRWKSVRNESHTPCQLVQRGGKVMDVDTADDGGKVGWGRGI